MTYRPLAYRLQFFSRPHGLDGASDDGSYGYDGSMGVASFHPDDLPALAARMDCICGPCMVIVSRQDEPDLPPSAYHFTRTCGE